MTDHANRIDAEAHRRLDQHDSLFDDIKTAIWGNPARHVKGLEPRVQEVEAFVRLLRFYGPIGLGLLAIIAAGQWPAVADLLSLLF